MDDKTRLEQIEEIAENIAVERVLHLERGKSEKSAADMLEKTPAWKAYDKISDECNNSAKNLNLMTYQLKGLMLEEFKETGEKKFDGIGGVAVTSKMEYDEGAAVDWCVENGKTDCLGIKNAKFKEQAIEHKLEFVTTSAKPHARINAVIEV